MKQLDIVIPKCDYLSIPFSYKVNNEPAQLEETDIIYFSLKEKLSSEEYIFQKTLNNGIVYNEEKEKYFIEIFYEDTKELTMGANYLYDLTIYYEGKKPVQKLFGNFKIGPKITLNEVV